MIHILNLARWEWFKLQRRKMPWILLAMLFVSTQLAVWGSYMSYSSAAETVGSVHVQSGLEPPGSRMLSCNELRSGSLPLPDATASGFEEQCRRQGARLVRQYQALSASGGASSALTVVGSLGLLLFYILTASVVGSEFGIGTLRPIFARGPGRLSFLAGKYVTLVAIAALAAIALCAAGAASGLASRAIALPPASGSPLLLTEVASPGVAVALVRNLGALVALITLTGAVTLLMRSTAAGMAICLVWFAGESIVVRLLSSILPNFDIVADYLPVRNIAALVAARASGTPSGTASDIGAGHASLVLAVYALLFAGIAAFVFRRRDIAGAAGS